MPRPHALALLAALTLPAQAAPLALSDTPLIVSSSIQPNVMLLMDTSGSMAHMLWADGYDPGVQYRNWQFRNGNSWSNIGTASGHRLHRNLGGGDCSGSRKAFRRGSSSNRICVTLPDPVGGGSTRYERNYLNYILETYQTQSAIEGAFANGALPDLDLMSVARNVAAELVTNTGGMRFGLTRFNNNEGGRVLAECGASRNSLISTIDGLTAGGWTPLAESLYEITRYFRGMSSFYNSNTSYTSPIQYRCQKNFTIVITDGLPTYDSTFPSNDPDDPEGRLPDWDGLSPETSQSDYPNFPPFSDGFDPETNSSAEGHALFLDDIAKFAWDIDMRKQGEDAAGVSFNQPPFARQNMHTYTIGFTEDNQMLEDAAEYGHGRYYTANNASELTSVLQQALRDIQARTGSAAAVAGNTGFVSSESRIFQARFNSTDWSGQLLAFEIETDRFSRTYGEPREMLWNAAEQLPSPGSRVILTRVNGQPARFRWGSFNTSQRNSWFAGSSIFLNYIRGQEIPGLRPRSTPLGDIVHSDPAYVGRPSARYPDNLHPGLSYQAFRDAFANRPAMVYAGANDGMLHGFDAETGAERLAYIPQRLLPELHHLWNAAYYGNHKFYVDGPATVADAVIIRNHQPAWRTVLVGGLNKGGQAIYALDVTDPDTFSENNPGATVLWEFTDADDADLGFTYSQPAIVRLQDGRWAAVFGNGYNNTIGDDHVSTSGNAVLYVVDLSDGSLIRKIDTATGSAQDPQKASRPNGLATVAPVDLYGNRRIDLVYAGDLFGNLWRFDLGHNNPASWSVRRLFTACGGDSCDADNRQPLTSRASVIRHPTGVGQIVLFGTGKYLEVGDKEPLSGGLQSFYGIWDRNSAENPPTRSQLLRQDILAETNASFEDPDGNSHSHALRVLSRNHPNWSQHRGWRLDLVPPSGTPMGERQVTHSVIRSGRVVFTTLIPGGDPCRPGGDSWLMEMDASSGGRLPYTPFDLNADYRFSGADYVTVTIDGESVHVPVSGLLLDGGAAATPAVMAAEGSIEFKYLSTADGLRVVREHPGPNDTGRQSWRQLIE